MVKMNHMLKQKKQQLIWFILIIFHYSSNVKVTVQIFWKEFGGVSIPTREEDLVGKWIAAIYETKTTSILYVGKMMRRFLKEKDGQTESMELDCLVPAYRKDTKVLSEVSEKFDRDVSIFQAENIIAGPLHAVYLGMANWSFADYPLINKLYSMVSKINRNVEYYIYFSN